MACCYWAIIGIGIETSKIIPYINKRRLFEFIRKQNCFNNKMSSTMFFDNSADVEDAVFNCGFDSIADVLCHCDDTDTLTYSEDGQRNWYFYYPPSMPWHHVLNEPKSEEEVISRIVDAIQKIADIDEFKIRDMIDTDLYVIGMG